MIDYEALSKVECVVVLVEFYALIRFYLKVSFLQSKLDNTELNFEKFGLAIRNLELNPIKLEVGKCYKNRMGIVHQIHYVEGGNSNFYRAGITSSWYQGGFNNYDKSVSPYDLVECVDKSGDSYGTT